MAVRVRLYASGENLQGEELQQLSDRARNAKPVFQVVLEDLIKSERAQFESSGAHGGRPWKQKKPQTLEREQRDTERRAGGEVTKPMRFTDHLMNSLAGAGKPKDSFRSATKQKATIATKVFYATFLDEELIGATRADTERRQNLLVDYLMGRGL